MRFNNLSHDEKLDLQKELLEKIEQTGGKFNFLSLLEVIRESEKHPLSNKTGKMHFKTGTITWDKHIYSDKVDILKQAALNLTDRNNNLLSTEKDKLKKQVLNTIKTMSKLNFVLKNKDSKDGEGFSFKPFKVISEKNIEFDPIFQIIFIDSVNNTKKILKYK